MLNHTATIRALAILSVVALGGGCGGPLEDVLEALRKGKHPPAGDAGVPPEPGPAPRCVEDLPPPPPGVGQCPAPGAPCPGNLPPAVPCRLGEVDAFMICQGPPGRTTWRLDLLECPAQAPPACADDLPPPPGNGQCPALGSSCPGTLPDLFPCRLGELDAFTACEGPAGRQRWRLAFLECR
jgi:hypothetical protein